MIYPGRNDRPLIHEDFQDTLIEERMDPKRLFNLVVVLVDISEECMGCRLVSMVDLSILDWWSMDGKSLAVWNPCECCAVVEIY